MYPFIEGTPYTGKAEQITAAGELLGRIHACSRSDNGDGLNLYSERCYRAIARQDALQRMPLPAPARPFTPREWRLFLRGYKQHVQLTPDQVGAWPSALEHMVLDQVLWLMANGPDGWCQAHQGRFLRAVLATLENLEAYRL